MALLHKLAFGKHARGIVAVLALFGQLVGAVGAPALQWSADDGGPAYPCQSRRCGCHSSAQCWSGDCCCFTLEEKLAWAEANGVEPPAHVRSDVAARKARGYQAAPARCCDDSGCCRDTAESDCPACAQKHATASVQVDWTSAAMMRTCRGLGPLGVAEMPPAICVIAISQPIEVACVEWLLNESCVSLIYSSLPAIPPPRAA